MVSERVAIKKLVPDGRPKPDCEHIPGRRGWITEAGSAFDVFVKGHRIESIVVEAKDLGMEVAAKGDQELALYFDPENREQARFAIRLIKARRKAQRTVTPEMLANLQKARQARGMPVAA